MAIHQSPNQRLLEAYREATEWYRWLTILCGHWPSDTDPRPRARSRGEAAEKDAARLQRRAVKRRQGNKESRKVTKSGDRWNEKSPHALRVAAAGGSAPPEDRLQALVRSKALHLSHCLRLHGDLVWCNHCGSYSQERFKALKASCPGSQHQKSKAGQLAQLRRGRHPLTGAIIGKAEATDANRAKALSWTEPEPKRVCDRRSISSTLDGATRALVVALSRPVCRVVGQALGKLV